MSPSEEREKKVREAMGKCRFYRNLVGFHGDFMGFWGILWDFMGFYGIFGLLKGILGGFFRIPNSCEIFVDLE